MQIRPPSFCLVYEKMIETRRQDMKNKQKNKPTFIQFNSVF